jgi:hypothetical protein
MFTYAFASCSIAWFPSIVPVGFLLAEVRPPTLDKEKLDKEKLDKEILDKEILDKEMLDKERERRKGGIGGKFNYIY